ncbi:phosphate ABC transporter substrate-binding/OmpA family protein [Alteromonas macleodii]|uniref:OmpA family protein n=1 Tax=Alteromonas macleodii TaxID=28108 RepID=A0AB36FL29_ALTMA|nr:phosphate ABC transporter substrate-binding/OmpA family protein [Alteromonas macleodii]OES24174.1 ompA family protein [Alteromonas macleodii]OES24808.1 ompA family protein [Alteromonas macleodii]OES25086.1 ompA family protein [Alteromonas macleodii]OES39129.1 ompA family protein [Alteromonas macleodii]
MSPKAIAIFVLVLGLFGLVAFKMFDEKSQSDDTLNTSDAQHIKSTVKIGVDNWTGYYLLCSRHFRSSLRNEGILAQCENDNADLDTRFDKLRRGKLQFAVTTVDAYVALGKDYDFPGAIVAVIDESKGGDALVANEDVIASIDDLKNNPALRIALTQDSPSEHLARSLAVHFDVSNLKRRGDWLVAADGSEDAAKKLQSGLVDAAVLWEPDVTKALQTSGIKKILGTEDTEKLIVDVLLVNRDLIKDDPDLVQSVIDLYFQTLQFYQQNPENLVRELTKETGLKSGAVQSMLKGVKWATLTDNAYDWFSIASTGSNQEYLVESIDSALSILQETGVMKDNPLPDANPYLLLQSSFVSSIFDTRIGSVDPSRLASSQSVSFPALSNAQWSQLREIGTLKVRKIRFARSSSDLSMDAKRMLDEAARDLAHYPNYRILIKGHTGVTGDADANLTLSQDRADAVLRYLNIAHATDENRLWAQGVGAAEPLPRQPNESNRSYRSRLPRVELILKAGQL